jgi:hypothetical protein
MNVSSDDDLVSFYTPGYKFGYKDKNGNIIIEPKFDDGHKFCEGLARVYVNRQGWGYIDQEGNFVIKPKWNRAFNFSGGKAEVSNSDGIFFIDKTGKIIEKINPFDHTKSTV